MTFRIIFAGTSDFSATVLLALAEAGHDIVLVLTRVDRPAGRGKLLQSSPVKKLSLNRGWLLCQPTTLRDQDNIIRSVNADVMVVASYGLILPEKILSLPRYGCLNVHASLLPRWRGAAPIERAIEAGDSHTGITIMQMNEGLDTGDCCLVKSIPISDSDTAGSLQEKLADLGAIAMLEALDLLASGKLTRWPQLESGATYAKKLGKTALGSQGSPMHWNLSARSIVNSIHAFNPRPGVELMRVSDGFSIKVWKARVVEAVFSNMDAEIGAVTRSDKVSLCVHASDGDVEILEVQKSGGKRLFTQEFLRGCSVKVGDVFVIS